MDTLLKAEQKKSYKKGFWIIFALVFLLFLINYKFLDSALISFLSTEDYLVNEKECFVERVVDGDTLVACGVKVRMLGINTPEKKDKYYSEAKNYLVKRVENKTVTLVFSTDRFDKYNRTLAYVYFGEKNINQELITNGFANAYFPSDKDKYFNPFLESFEQCISSNKNLCEKSIDECFSCIKLVELDYINEKVILANECSSSCDLTSWTIKDEGRKVFVFPEFILEPNSEVQIVVLNKTGVYKNKIYWNSKDYVWTDSGDTLFLRDSEGKLVLYKNYF